MDPRSALFGRGSSGGAGLPGRPNQRPAGNQGMAPPPPSGYDNYGPRSPGRPQGAPGGGGGYGGGGYGGGYGSEPKAPAYQQAPQARQVPLRLAKVEDKTMQTQFIFGNMYVTHLRSSARAPC